MKQILCLLIVLCFSSQSLAAVESFGDKASVGKVFLEIPGYNLDFKAKDGGTTLKYRPNVAGITGVSLSFLGLFGVTYGFRNPIAKDEQDTKGKTIYDDFRFAFAYEEMNFDLNFQSYKGFYLENSRLADPTFRSGDPYYQDPEMKLENLSANFTYTWSPDQFSMPATLDQTVRQTESGGSFLLGAGFTNTSFSSETSLIPLAASAAFGSEATLTEANFMSITAQVGYGYSFVLQKYYYATLAGLVGGGPQMGSFKTTTTSESGSNFVHKIDALAGLGYNGDTFISGLIVKVDATGYQTEEIEISSQIFKVNLFVGGRF